MKFTYEPYSLIKRKCVSQVLVWRGKHPAVNGLAKNIFFNHLLQDYKYIITDAMQTSDGERFWDNKITDIFSMNYHVYFINFMQTREIRKLKNHKEFRELADNEQIWGDHHKFQARKLVISKDLL